MGETEPKKAVCLICGAYEAPWWELCKDELNPTIKVVPDSNVRYHHPSLWSALGAWGNTEGLTDDVQA